MFYCIVLTIIFQLTIVNRIVVDGNKAMVSHMADQKQMLTLFVSFRTTSYRHIIIKVDIISWHILTWIFNTQFIIHTSRMVGNIQYLLYINHWCNMRDIIWYFFQWDNLLIYHGLRITYIFSGSIHVLKTW